MKITYDEYVKLKAHCNSTGKTIREVGKDSHEGLKQYLVNVYSSVLEALQKCKNYVPRDETYKVHKMKVNDSLTLSISRTQLSRQIFFIQIDYFMAMYAVYLNVKPSIFNTKEQVEKVLQDKITYLKNSTYGYGYQPGNSGLIIYNNQVLEHLEGHDATIYNNSAMIMSSTEDDIFNTNMLFMNEYDLFDAIIHCSMGIKALPGVGNMDGFVSMPFENFLNLNHRQGNFVAIDEMIDSWNGMQYNGK